ncbi:MAG: calcium/sodium antiporter [Oceanospirillaceae bacterium]|nr:calcium/sodium antiporter [Oceanospirillaceae bacterium]
MILEIGAVLAGLVLLVWSADQFVVGAAATARHLGMSPLLVGLTIVSIGTSAPEMFVSAMAALDNAGNLAIGNAIGSNITNIGLVLGITALIAPIPIQKQMMKKELPLLLVVSVIGGLVLLDLSLNLMDSMILLAAFLISMFILFRFQGDSGEPAMDEEEAEAIEHTSTAKALVLLVAGLAVLMVSSKLLVWGATGIAQTLGVSDLVIGLTIVAIGTSLPELAASVASALKGHHDIAIGNVIGSNLFNLLIVMPVPGLITITAVEPDAFNRDYMVMMGLTTALILLIMLNFRNGRVGRFSGVLLTGSYVAYLASLFMVNQ